MARKFNFDMSIVKNMQAASADSFADNIKMVDIDSLIPSDNNFYDVSDIELLADDIERQGLKHNLVVADNYDGTYTVVSGHRRTLAKKLLIDQGRTNTHTLPCYIIVNKSVSEIKMDLIMLNATQRKYSDADLLNEYENLIDVCKQLESDGKRIPGRIREYAAKTLRVSPAQIGKIENIKNNAIPDVVNSVKSGEVSISTANEIAKLSPSKQQALSDNNKLSFTAAKAFKTEEQDRISEKPEDEYTPPDEKPSGISVKEDKDDDTQLVSSLSLAADEIKVIAKYIDELMEQCRLTEPYDYTVLKRLSKKLIK